ncbi:hypothetical protein M6B22_11120 [Jatrophihabitans cynanchi]|uniref:Uncharacterized protein n=1 Tax=Jatrophihabitans cynanchi TaxID=2944128 RepID=A0ABY7JVJ8_9ACTN|nr:hypothetical protein [Jatrophihabitans sp. SB3-54]WAX55111.1 hypothetical protein M6B22_11120 [Jatrophihabitans sp. SB3-54]
MTSKRKRLGQYRAWCDHTRALAYDNARALAVAIVGADQPALRIYDFGIVLGEGEVVWQRTPADYWWRGQQTWTEQRTSYNGGRSTLTNIRRPVLNCAGTLEWLITNQRLVAREPTGEVISIYWTAIEAVGIDLTAEVVVLDGADGYHGELRGPAIAPVAVAAIGCCHGPYALLDHPALAALRAQPAHLMEVLKG